MTLQPLHSATGRIAKRMLERSIRGNHHHIRSLPMAFSTLATTSTSNNLNTRYTRATLREEQFAFSTLSEYENSEEDDEDRFGPAGTLFDLKLGEGLDQTLVGKEASVRRVFGPNANAHVLLTCGGEELARHASFDPDYTRARGWIQNRAIGPAVLSPVLISGLVGALVEAAFPQSVPVTASMHQARPLIVGQEVNAKIQVIGIKHFTRGGEEVSTKEKDFGSRQEGHEIQMITEVVRFQDDEVIAEGTHFVWIPGYLSR